jgi:hypothetical protein
MVATADSLIHLEPTQLEDEAILDRVRRRMLLPGAASSHDDFADFFNQCRDVADATLSRVEAGAHDMHCVPSSTCDARGWVCNPLIIWSSMRKNRRLCTLTTSLCEK